MSVKSEIRLMCDSCGHESESVRSTVRWARYYAKEEGWAHRKIDGKWKDLCDYCQDQEDNADVDQALEQVVPQ